MNPVEEILQSALDKRKINQSLRSLSVNEGLVDFCSNDYLGFSTGNLLMENFRKITEDSQIPATGSTGSRLLTGNSLFAENLEAQIAQHHSAQRALIFNSGYIANLSLFSCVPQKGDTVIYDELIHASIRDGIRLCSARSWSFRHNDATDLKKKISAATGNLFVVVESVYSMDGDLAPLSEISELCGRSGANLIVDEAHATGVFGDNGEGLVSAMGLQESVFARVITFGKALGSHGAAILGSATLVNYLLNFARPLIYTTSLPFHALATIKAGYDLLPKSEGLRKKLRKNIQHFGEHFPKNNVISNQSPIISVLIPGNEKVRRISNRMISNGLNVRAILSPTVPEGKERLRIILHAFNSEKEIEFLIENLEQQTLTNIYKGC